MAIVSSCGRLRAAALLLGITATTGLAACGGDGGGGTASKEDYQRSLNAFCADLLAKQESMDADVDGALNGSDPAKGATAMADYLREYGAAMTTGLEKLADTGVPAAYETFDAQLSAGVKRMAKISTDTAEKIRQVDLSGVAKGDTSGLTELQSALGELSKQQNPLENLQVPADIEQAAPKCEQLFGGRA